MLNLEVVSRANTKQGTAFHCTITFDLTCQGCGETSLIQMGVVMTSRTAISSQRSNILPALKALHLGKSCLLVQMQRCRAGQKKRLHAI